MLTRTVPMTNIEDLPPSISWGAMDLGPTLPAFDEHRCSLWQGQNAPPLARLDYLRVERTFCIFLRA
jgi:hypothetical protein